MATISASEARQTLPEQLDRVEAGEEVTITRHGRAVAVLISPHALKSRRSAAAWVEADALAETLADAKTRPLGSGALSSETVEELVQDLHEGRRTR